MIYLCTATYFEGEYFIKKLNMKKDTSANKFQIFYSNNIKLIITGIGKINSASAVVYMFSKNEPSSCDLLINYGLCTASLKSYHIGDTFLCNKIIDCSSKRTFYPDILYKNDFKEECIETLDHEADKNTYLDCNLADMEASGIYQGALFFLQTDQLFFIKTISDYLNGSDINKNSIKDNIQAASDIIIRLIERFNFSYKKEESVLSPKDIELIDSLSSNLKFSVSMKNEITRELSYYKLTHGFIPETISKYIDFSCSSKKEGKNYAKSIKNELV